MTLPTREYVRLITAAAAAGLSGGAIYDALIAATVRESGATLLTRDQRARLAYDALRVRHELVE